MDEISPLLSEVKDKAKNDCNSNDNQEPKPDTHLHSVSTTDSPSKDSVKTTNRNIWKDTNWQQKAMIFYIGLVNFLNFLCNGTASPFLARVVLQKGGTVLTSSFVLETSMVMMAIFSLLIAKYQSRIGCRKLILFGQVLFALCQIGFGAIEYFDNLWSLILVGATLRAIQGVCQAALVVGGLTVVCQEFPDFISTVFGIFEAAYGAGYLTGPYLGGFLFDESNGMMLPMAVSGIVTLLFTFVGLNLLKKADEYIGEEGTSPYVIKMLSNPKAILVIGTSATVAGAFTLCDATVTVYMKSLGYSATTAGQLLFLMGVSYCVFAFVAGWGMSARKGYRRFSMTVGLLGALGLPLVFTSNQTYGWIYTAAFGFAMCVAIAFIPALDELLYVIDAASNDTSQNKDMSLSSAVSGLWSAAVAFGNFIVPLIGSGFEMVLPFSVSFSLSLLTGYILTFLLAAIAVLCQQIHNKTFGKKCTGNPELIK